MRTFKDNEISLWPHARARFLFREVVERNHDLPLASVTKDGGVEFRDDLDISVWNPAEDVSSYKRVLPGDFVIGLRSFQSGIGFSKISGLVSPAYTVLRPTEPIEHRYCKHYFKSDVLISQLENVAQGIRQGRTISTESFYNLRLPTPPARTQRAIADFLDAETARIDALIEKKRRLLEMISSRVWLYLESVIDGLNARSVPLRRCVRTIHDGPFGSAFRAEDYSESGAFVVRLGNIGFGEFRDENRAFIPFELYSRFLRHQVRAGDLLIAGLGDEYNHAGRACVAPDLGHAMVKGKCFCAQIDSSMADTQYLALFLSSRLGAEAIGIEARGSTRTMINLEIVKAATIPLPQVQRQKEIVERFQSQMARTTRLVSMLSNQIELLTEHRQAIITAAVTGQLEVSGV